MACVYVSAPPPPGNMTGQRKKKGSINVLSHLKTHVNVVFRFSHMPFSKILAQMTCVVVFLIGGFSFRGLL